uniref:Uncharacterized protein n=1 Tax=Pipistrellus kuhlii TaxID=59472 RepID=A0A7J7YWK3_PIPKU|nr:hypothetical protein mPipKuh1_009826 [Pipistrellus kuhlii]
MGEKAACWLRRSELRAQKQQALAVPSAVRDPSPASAVFGGDMPRDAPSPSLILSPPSEPPPGPAHTPFCLFVCLFVCFYTFTFLVPNNHQLPNASELFHPQRGREAAVTAGQLPLRPHPPLSGPPLPPDGVALRAGPRLPGDGGEAAPGLPAQTSVFSAGRAGASPGREQNSRRQAAAPTSERS